MPFRLRFLFTSILASACLAATASSGDVAANFSDEGRAFGEKAKSRSSVAEGSTNKPAPQLDSDEPKLKQGRWSYDAEQLAKAVSCISTGKGALVIHDEGFRQKYEIECQDGRKVHYICDNIRCAQN